MGECKVMKVIFATGTENKLKEIRQITADLDIEIAWVEIVDPAAVSEFDSDYLYHCFISYPAFSMTPEGRPAPGWGRRRTPSAPAASPVSLLSYIELPPL